MGNTKASFAVINLHCKNFKDKTRALAEFILRAQKKVEDHLVDIAIKDIKEEAQKLKPQDAVCKLNRVCSVQQSEVARIKRLGIPVIVVGDMNIDSKFKKGLSAEHMATAVVSAGLGKLPNGDAVDLTALND